MIYKHTDVTRNIDEECDVCVVGSGAGGAPMAKELAEAGLATCGAKSVTPKLGARFLRLGGGKGRRRSGVR